MAESQVPYPYLVDQKVALRAAISEPRFATYLRKAGGHERYAFALYLYNARVAKAFWYPLNVAEVTFRNAVDEALVAAYGGDWPIDPDLRDSLTTEHQLSLTKAIRRAGHGARKADIVATLTFDFWSNLMRPQYGQLWRTRANVVFPNLSHGESRRDVQKLAKEINDLRNRIAHHEPILDANLPDALTKIVRLIDLRCRETAAWTKHYATVSTVIRSRPKRDSEVQVTLADRCDTTFTPVTTDTGLVDLMAAVDPRRPAILVGLMAGLVAIAVVLVAATAYGLWHRSAAGRLRAERPADGSAVLDAVDLGADLGERATLVQFSSAFCQPCRATRRVLDEVAGTVPGVAH
ncbi:MAG: hypothetical protein DI640_15085, partial [Sphingomonas taxi]